MQGFPGISITLGPELMISVVFERLLNPALNLLQFSSFNILRMGRI